MGPRSAWLSIGGAALPADAGVSIAEPLAGGRQPDEIDERLIVAQPIREVLDPRPDLREHDDVARRERRVERFAEQLPEVRQVPIDELAVCAAQAFGVDVLVVDRDAV